MARGKRRSRSWLRVALLAAALTLLAGMTYSYATLPQAAPLASKNPETTALIEHRARQARAKGTKPRRRQRWVPLSAIAPLAVQSVLTSEDSAFYLHDGVDTRELKKAVQESIAKRELGRGASTITQQLAKNLWLSGERSLWRKAKELVLAKRLERDLKKSRILTLYLNVVEWGDGIYGIEAAAREYFGHSAAELSLGEGAILASMLPSPLKRHPVKRSRASYQRAMWIIDRLEETAKVSAEQAAEARDVVESTVGRSESQSAADDEYDL